MFSALVDQAVRNRVLVLFLVLLALALGGQVMPGLPIDAVPDVTNVQVQVLTDAPGLAPEEVERFITFPVETVMGGLPRLEQVRSLSRFGLSAVTVVFEDGTDIYFARQLVAERLAEAREALPASLGSPEMGPISSGLGEIYQFEVRGEPMCPAVEGEVIDRPDCFTLMELRELLDQEIAPQLRAVPGVVELNSFGGELTTFEVTVDPERLSALDLSLTEVFEALERANLSVGGGPLEQDGEQRLIRGEGLISSIEDLRWVALRTGEEGAPVHLRDVALLQRAPMLRQGAVSRDGRGDVVTGIAMMLLGANAREVSRAVDERLDGLRAGLPEGVTIETFYDRTDLVNRTIDTVVDNLWQGALLVVVALLLILGNLPGGLLVAALIPVTMALTFVAMRWWGISANLMSLGALNFGIAIDGAVVVVENIVRRMGEEGAHGHRTAAAVARAGREVARPVVFSIAIVILVYVPILSLSGIEGRMFRPMAATVIAALSAALLLSLTMVPALAAWVFRRGVADRETAFMRFSQRLYRPALDSALAHPRVVIGLALAGLLAAGLSLPFLGAEFAPRLDEGALALQAIRPPSTSLAHALVMTDRVEEVLLEAFPDEVQTVISRTGRAEIATDPMGVEVSDIIVMLHPRRAWTRARYKADLVEQVAAVLEERVPGQNYSFSQPIELRTNELISGARSDIALSLFGPDLDILAEQAQAIVGILSALPGAEDVNADALSGLPMLRIQLDRRALARYGIDATDALSVVSAMAGHQVGEVLQGQRRYALQVRLAESARDDLERIRQLPVRAPGGAAIPLGQLARLTLEDGPAVISRENVQRRVTIQLNVRGRDLAGFVTEAKAALDSQLQRPPGTYLSWGGQFENLAAATERLRLAVPAALALIFLLLYGAYGELRPALLIFAHVPIAAVGGVFALLLRGLPLSVSAGVGFIALSGIAVLNGVVMVSVIRQLQIGGMPRQEACREGASRRLRAALMTAVTDGIGFLPMALAVSAGAEVQRPLATVVIGGMVSATWMTLFVLPVVYARLGGHPGAGGDQAAL